MTDTHTAKLMWDAYAFRAGGITFDGKPLPTWDELGEDRQSCWLAAASVTADRIKKLEAALYEVAKLNNRRDRFSSEIDAVIVNVLEEYK